MAHLRDEPTTLIIGVDNAEEVEKAKIKIEDLRASGDLLKIIQKMHLDLDEQ